MRGVPFICLITFLSFGLIAANTANLTPQQQAGKQIYTKGIGSTQEKVTANMSGVVIPGTVMPCISCHNANGTGNPEGGITPSNITWKQLTRSYGGKRISGETYPPYTERTLRQVITTGIDPGGNKLHNAMPTYNMTRVDLDNLIAYIKVLGEESELGLTDSTIHIGFGLKGKAELNNGKNEAVKKLVNAYCSNINTNGSIYNRKMNVSFFYSDEAINEDDYFIIAGSKTESKTTTTTPGLILFSEGISKGGLNNKNTFYIYPSLTSQSNALVDFSKEENLLESATPISILYAENAQQKTIAQNLKNYCLQVGTSEPDMLAIHAENTAQISDRDAISNNSVVFFIGGNKLGNQLIQELATRDKYPHVLCPGSVSGIDLFNLPQSAQDKVFISYPTWLTERSINGIQFYKKLNSENELSQKWKNSQLDALSIFLTVEECLKRIGRDLSRDKFVSTLENMHEFQTGLTPALSYSKNQRVGTGLVYIAGFDKASKKLKLVKTISSNG